MNKLTRDQLVQRVAALAVELHRAESIAKTMRARLNREYQLYFQVHGEPDPQYRGIRVDDPRYEGVIKFTGEAYAHLQAYRRKKHSAKRKLAVAVKALMLASADRVVPPKRVVRRVTAAGVTLQ